MPGKDKEKRSIDGKTEKSKKIKGDIFYQIGQVLRRIQEKEMNKFLAKIEEKKKKNPEKSESEILAELRKETDAELEAEFERIQKEGKKKASEYPGPDEDVKELLKLLEKSLENNRLVNKVKMYYSEEIPLRDFRGRERNVIKALDFLQRKWFSEKFMYEIEPEAWGEAWTKWVEIIWDARLWSKMFPCTSCGKGSNTEVFMVSLERSEEDRVVVLQLCFECWELFEGFLDKIGILGLQIELNFCLICKRVYTELFFRVSEVEAGTWKNKSDFVSLPMCPKCMKDFLNASKDIFDFFHREFFREGWFGEILSFIEKGGKTI